MTKTPTSLQKKSEAKEEGASQLNEEARKLLEACCEASVPAVIVGLESAAICHGSFALAQKTDLSFHLSSSQTETGIQFHADLFKPAEMCSVSFMAGSRGGVFLSVIKRFEEKDGAGKMPALVLAYPNQLALAERRRSFRVDVARDSGLTATIKDGTRIRKAYLVNDISYDGIQVEAAAGEDWGFPMESLVQVELQMDVHKVLVKGEIRRKMRTANSKSDTYVILFFKSFSGGCAEPPEDMRQLVCALDLLAVRRTIK